MVRFKGEGKGASAKRKCSDQDEITVSIRWKHAIYDESHDRGTEMIAIGLR